MRNKPLDGITKISKRNLDRIHNLKISGYEPNDYIISLAIGLLEHSPEKISEGKFQKSKLDRTSKISAETLARISKLKISGYEPNDFIIGKALDLLEKERNGKKD